MIQCLPMLLTIVLLSSCSTVSQWIGFGDEVVEIEDDGGSAKDSANEAPELRSPDTNLGKARIWARLDELEDQIRAQGQKIVLLERGLLLGIIPEELKHPADRVRPLERHDNVELMPAVAETVTEQPKKAEVVAEKKAEPVDEKAFQMRLAEAQDFFRTGRYGRAITSFEKLAVDYPSKVKDGSHLYWIGLSWYNLKEYETAKEVFEDLLALNAASPWAARAKFNIARSNNALGLRRQAVSGLKDIIKSHPYEDAAEMSRMEIQRIEQAL